MKRARWILLGIILSFALATLLLPVPTIGHLAQLNSPKEGLPIYAPLAMLNVNAIAEGIFTGPVGIVISVSAATPESSFSRDTPFSFETMTGNQITLQAPTSATVNGRAVQFVEWRSGDTVLGSDPRLVRTVSGPQTITAVYNPACCRLIFTAQQDTGEGLTVPLNFEQPPSGQQTTPVILDVAQNDRIKVSAPATVGNLRFQRWLSLTENITLGRNTLLEGGIDRALTIAAIYKLDCALVPAPTVAITAPQNSLQVINDNSFSIQGTVTADQTPASVKVEAMNDRGELNAVSIPLYGTGPDFIFSVANLTGLLYPGNNVVKVRAEGLCGKVGEASVLVNFIAPFKPPTACVAGQPASQTINFSEFDAGTSISSHYAGLGAIFPNYRSLQAPVIIDSGGNRMLRVTSSGDFHNGPLVIQFAEPQKSVRLSGGLGAGVVGSSSATLKAFNRQSGGQLVTQDGPRTIPSTGAAFMVNKSDLGDIYRVEFEIASSGVEVIDDLIFERECNPQPPVPETVDLFVQAMEITQAINPALIPAERPANDAFFNTIAYDGTPLIKDRFTVVRVYAGINGASAPAFNINARLFGYKGAGLSASEVLGGLDPVAGFRGPAGQTITIASSDDLRARRADINLSWNFLLPLAWTEQGPIKLVAEINRPATVAECREPVCIKNNEIAVYDIGFVVTRDIRILPVTVSELGGQRVTPPLAAECSFSDIVTVPCPGNPGAQCCELNTQIGVDRPRYFQGVYPVREGGVFIQPIAGNLSYDGNPSISDILDDLQRKFGATTTFGIPVAHGYTPGLIVVGLAPSGDGGEAKRSDSFAAISVGQQVTAAHETGHTIGMKHASDAHDEQCSAGWWIFSDSDYHCDKDWPYPHGGIGEFGFDTRNWRVIDPGDPPARQHVHELMSYGEGTPLDNGNTGKWTSPRNYCYVISRLGGGSSAYCDRQRSLPRAPDFNSPDDAPDAPSQPARASLTPAQTQPPEFLWVRGRISQQGSVEFFPFYRLVPSAPPEDPPPTGFLTLEAQDRNGQVLVTRKFDFQIAAGDDLPTLIDFSQLIPFNQNIDRVLIKHDSQLLGTRSRSANAPTVRVLTPNGGESWGSVGTQVISWQAQDADSGDTLFYRVQYSRDGGQTWLPLSADLTLTSYTVNLTDLPGGDQALVRVLATDGFNTTQDQSDGYFRVSKKAPKVVITGLRGNDNIVPDNLPLGLTATGTDFEDGALPDDAFKWTTDDGILVAGRYFNVQTLPLGQHIITLTAKDHDGMETSVTLPRPLTVIPGKVIAPSCCTLSFIAQQDKGVALSASFNVLMPISDSRITPFTLNLSADDRVSVAAPAAIGNLRFLYWRSVTNNRILTTSATLLGSADQNETFVAVYQLPATVSLNIVSICEGCVTGPAQFTGLTINALTPALGNRVTPFTFDVTQNGRVVLTAPATMTTGGRNLRFKRWISVTDNRVLTTSRTLSGQGDKSETLAAVYQPLTQ